jgi:hypothetical protein
VSATPRLRTETNLVSETCLCVCVCVCVWFYFGRGWYQTMDEVQEGSNSEYYAPWSEPFRIYELFPLPVIRVYQNHKVGRVSALRMQWHSAVICGFILS